MNGAFSSQIIRSMIEAGRIKSQEKVSEGQIQPASLDLKVGSKAYRIKGMFLPQKGERVSDLLKNYAIYEIDLKDNELILEKDAPYLIELSESLDLDLDMWAITNNKSSTGRINLVTRLVTDFNPRFDKVEKGYSGKLYLQVLSKSFLIGIKQGQTLNQMRFFNSDSRLNDLQMSLEMDKFHLLYDKNGKPVPRRNIRIDKGVLLSIDLSAEISGWVTKTTNEVIHLDKVNHYSIHDFWEPIHTPQDGHIVLTEGNCYIFCTKEKVRIPPEFAAELVSFDSESGEFRSHDAGFFDPGFGYGKSGEILGTTGVLEVRPFGSNIVLRHAQPVCRLVYERMIEVPDRIYGVDLDSNYQGQQGPRLSKHFRMPSIQGQMKAEVHEKPVLKSSLVKNNLLKNK